MNNKRDAVIVAYGRSPLARAYKGSFAKTHPIEYGAQTLKGVIAKLPNFDPLIIDDVIVGCSFPEKYTGNNVGRLIAQRAGLPDSIPGQTVNRFCSSSLQTIATAATAAGSSTLTMTSLPGTPALTNVIPTQFLGTTLTAAPIFGIIASIAFIVMTLLYFKYSEKKARANNEYWVNPEGFDIAINEIQNRSMLPSSIKAFLPIIIVLIIIVVGSRFGLNSTMLATGAMLAGTVVVCVLNFNKLKEKNIKKILSSGLEGGIGAIGGFAGVVAFGTVVSNSQAFALIVEKVLSLKMNPYTQGVVATSVVSAITGSSSGGLRIMFGSFTDSFLASGVNLDLLHRLVSIAAGALDTLPHSPGIFLTLAVLGLTHKEAYKHIFVTTVAIPTIITLGSLGILVMFF